MNPKKILINTYYFPPDNNPRSFRAFELAKYFSNEGHSVTITFPDNEHDYTHLVKQWNFKILKIPFLLKYQASRFRVSGRLSYLKKVMQYFTGPKDNLYAFRLVKILKTEIVGPIDLIISISLPFGTALGTAIFLRNFKSKGVAIADYGDPYYHNPAYRKHIIHKYLEKWALRKFDKVIIPGDVYKPYFSGTCNQENLIVIPQGIDINAFHIAEYHENKIPTFGYAGLFYDKLRDPTEFLEFLMSVKINFRFIIYTDVSKKDNDGVDLVVPFLDKLGEKLILDDLIGREECIYQLSKVDFLVTFEQKELMPSKLIDYKIADRPVLLVDKGQQYQDYFHQFLEGDFSGDIMDGFDIDKYDISKVGKQFLELAR